MRKRSHQTHHLAASQGLAIGSLEIPIPDSKRPGRGSFIDFQKHC